MQLQDKVEHLAQLLVLLLGAAKLGLVFVYLLLYYVVRGVAAGNLVLVLLDALLFVSDFAGQVRQLVGVRSREGVLGLP